MNKTKIKFKEKVTFIGTKKSKTVNARVDTGAKRCSIDKKLAEYIGVSKPRMYKTIKSASGIDERPVVKIKLTIKNRTFNAFCTIADRSRLKFPALIGRNIIRHGFIIEDERK
ncbi:ATP-dependent zinc protease [Candidatus Woesearchaeota archaeon]|nr:ATP-dependent zinc protease [Candidatus Woesearchaeota archaeon]